MSELINKGTDAKKASRVLSCMGTKEKNNALEAIADAIEANAEIWLEANRADLINAEKNGMKQSLVDRLTLTTKRISQIANGVRQIIALPDPIGKVDKAEKRPNGLFIEKRRVPLGVIAMIYEARPNVTVDAAALCLKSGNACILRGGKEAIESNKCAVSLMRSALEKAGLPVGCISLVEDTSRDSAVELMHLDKYVDVLIPRGGANLIRTVAREASVPVIRTGEGVCHIYIDKDADIRMGAEILTNAKCSRPSVCNAAECVLVHKAVANEFLKEVYPMLSEYSVELRCDEPSFEIVSKLNSDNKLSVLPAAEEDWDTEFGDYILAVRTVDDFEEAVEFISAHSTNHSEAIITRDYFTARKFLDQIDAAAVYVNASTRFTDGGEFGLGAEIGISTQKLHARGPMGLDELTSVKYAVYGEGQIR